MILAHKTLMAQLALGLDVGTQGTKALLLNIADGTVLSIGAASYGLIETDVPGRAEQHPDAWISGVAEAVRLAIAQLEAAQGAAQGSAAQAITAIGVSGQQHGLVVLDQDRQVLRPAKLWCDVESAAEAQELSQALGHKLVPSFTATKLLWLKRHEPHVWARVRHVLLPHDYVNFWLTGRLCMEGGDASGTGLLDVRTRQWDDRAVSLIDAKLKDWLPPLVGPSEVVGLLTERAAQALGGLRAGLVAVSPGSGDNACAALGVGLHKPGPMVLSLGTSGTLFGKSPGALLDPTGVVCPFLDATGGGLPLLCTLNCTMPPGEVAASFGLGHERATELAAQEPAGCQGLTYLPYLCGERTPDWPHASGTLLGLRPGMLGRPGLLYRAALEGVVLSLLAGAQRMQALGLPPPTELRLVGGGAKSPLLRRIVTDAFQLPVRMPKETEAAALGAALQAVACAQGSDVASYVQAHPPCMLAEVLMPDPNQAGAYAEALERHVRLGQVLFSRVAAA